MIEWDLSPYWSGFVDGIVTLLALLILAVTLALAAIVAGGRDK